MRVLKYAIATAALLVGNVVAAPSANAAEAYGAEFSMFFYGENWPCPSGCTNSWGYSWGDSSFLGVTGGPSWNDSGHSADVSISYSSIDCTTDDWFVTIDGSGASGGGSNPGVLSMSIHRIGTVFTGTAWFTSTTGTGDSTYLMSGVVYPAANPAIATACLGGAKVAAGFSWSGAMAAFTL